MRNITKIKRSVKAISPVVAVLLMIAIAVVAAIVAYAWVMGYLGFQTERADNQIQIQSFHNEGNLIIYVQNTGQGTVHLKQDSSVYVNDVLKDIINANDVAVGPQELIPIVEGQTVKIEVNYQNFKEGDRIKIVTVEGTSMETTGNNGSGNSGGGGSQSSPTARFSFNPATPSVGQTVAFTDSSVAGSGTINQWSWNFGTGATPSTSTTRNPTASYTTAGLKTISLTVTDSNGKTSITTKTLNVETNAQSQAPVAEFSMSTTNPNVLQNVAFADLSIAGSSTINQWSWNFGDGQISAAQNPTHAYSTPGSKTITLTVTDSNSKTSTVTHTLTVDYVSPTANFGYSPSAPKVRESITFTDTSTAGSGAINQWSWSFGDGATSTLQNPTHAYTATGPKTVMLTVTDSNSKTSSTSKTVTVVTDTQSQAPSAEFTMSRTNPGVQQTVTFTDTSTAGTGTINQWSWNFGDGQTSTSKNPTHAYSTTGSKTITLTVTDTNSLTSTISHTLTVENIVSPTASFIYTPTSPITGQAIMFTDTSTAGSGAINQWSWSFGDGATSTLQNPTHAYTATGPKTVMLTVTDSNSKTSTTTNTITVANGGTVVFNTGFDGNPWDQGWIAGGNPPFYRAVGEGVDGTAAAKSDPYTTNGVPNDGPFTSNEMNTNIAGATAIHITFMYKVHDTNSATDLKVAYSTVHNPNLNAGSPHFNYIGNIGKPGNEDQWYQGSYTLLKSTTPSAFTSSFSFRFESDLRSGAGGIVEQVWVDNIQISVS